MSLKRDYSELDDPESGFGSAESDHSPPEVKNFRFENGDDIVTDNTQVIRSSARLIQRSRDDQKHTDFENSEETIENAKESDNVWFSDTIEENYPQNEVSNPPLKKVSKE